MADIAAAFQEAVVDVITSKAVLACREHGIKDVLLGGGVAANSRLRSSPASAVRPPESGSMCRRWTCARTTAPWWRPSVPSW